MFANCIYSRPMLMIYCLFCLFLFYLIQQLVHVHHAGAPCGGLGTCFIYSQRTWVLPYWRSRGHYKPVLIFVLLHTQKKTILLNILFYFLQAGLMTAKCQTESHVAKVCQAQVILFTFKKNEP